MGLSKKDFLEEINAREYPLSNEDYAYGEWKNRVEPYLHLITKFRSPEKQITSNKLRLGLGVSSTLWSRFVKMPTFQDYFDSDGEVMSIKAQMDIVRAVGLKPDNAVAVKLQAERFDPFYIEEGKDVGKDGLNFEFKIVDGKQSDEEISKKVNIDIDKK